MAHGLAAFLNTTAVDENFRRFNGHTQVNATDLRLMRYPSRDTLIEFGEWAAGYRELTQAMLDAKLATLAERVTKTSTLKPRTGSSLPWGYRGHSRTNALPYACWPC